jgi:hypothetical protein
MIHSPSLLAPLARHDRLNDVGEQTVVTISDAFAWTHPESMPSRKAAWTIAMAKRAHRHADAVVVPTHATADRLAEFIDFGDRIRIIGGAPSTLLELRPQTAMADSDGDGAAHEGARGAQGAGSASSFRRASLGTGVGGAIILDVELAPTRGSQRRGIRWVPATSTSTSGELLLILPSPTL